MWKSFLFASLCASAFAQYGGAWSSISAAPAYQSSSSAAIAASLATVTPVTTPTTTGMPTGLATYMVTVGGPGAPAYNPPTLTGVKTGDTIAFLFLEKNHTVTESSFDAPCAKVDAGFASGFVPSDGMTVPYMVAQYSCSDPNDNCSPMWLYCGQSDHCEVGMRLSINAPTAKDQAWRAIDTLQNPQCDGSNAAAATASMAYMPVGTGVVAGTGVSDNGSCNCQCLCGAANPLPAGLGMGMVGGTGGSIPMMSAPSANTQVVGASPQSTYSTYNTYSTYSTYSTYMSSPSMGGTPYGKG